MELQLKTFSFYGKEMTVSFWCDYTPASSGRVGHIDYWSEDTEEEFEFSNVQHTNGMTTPLVWLDASPELVEGLQETMVELARDYIESEEVDLALANSGRDF
tara:strand:- start:1331 stop:1636 length:306 start_codon:yes stop_codon:yes gene_type:complete